MPGHPLPTVTLGIYTFVPRAWAITTLQNTLFSSGAVASELVNAPTTLPTQPA